MPVILKVHSCCLSLSLYIDQIVFKSKTVTRRTHSHICIGGKRAIPHVSKQAPTCFCSFIIIVLVSFLMFIVYKCSAGKQWTPPELSNWLCQFVGGCHADLWRTEFSHSSIDGLFHYTFLTTKLHHCSTFSPCVDNDSHRASLESHTSLHHVIWNSSTHKVTSRGRWGADPMLSHLFKYKVASYSCVTAVHGWSSTVCCSIQICFNSVFTGGTAWLISFN